VIEKIISGGQTGADRAGLDVAISLNINHGGYCPKGRLAENGPIPMKYNMIEMGSAKYHYRTEKNVQESCGTVIFSRGRLARGSKLTLDYCLRHKKPCLHIDFNFEDENKPNLLIDFIKESQIQILNVAGQRLSSEKTIYSLSYQCLREALSDSTLMTNIG
jgi:hypothetical protein